MTGTNRKTGNGEGGMRELSERKGKRGEFKGSLNPAV